MPFIRTFSIRKLFLPWNDFNMKSLCLLGEGLLVFDIHMPSVRRAFVICSWKSVWYLLRCMEIVRNICVLGDMVFVRYIRNICGKYVRIVCEECICKIYGSMRWII